MRVAHTEANSGAAKSRKAYPGCVHEEQKNLLVKKENAEYTEYSAYMADGKLLYVERSLKNGTDELTEYIWAGSTLWAEKRKAGTESAVYYHHTDYHGSTEAITDEAGVVVWKAGYDAYGNMLQATGVMEFEASYTGKMYDRDTGLYYFNARWYDSELGRFTTPDPARDGVNWLVYCAANPVGRWDSTGLGTLDDFAYQQRTKASAGNTSNTTSNGSDSSNNSNSGNSSSSKSSNSDTTQTVILMGGYKKTLTADEIFELLRQISPLGKEYSTNEESVYVCTTYMEETLKTANLDVDKYLPGGQKVVDSISILSSRKNTKLLKSNGTNPTEGVYVFYYDFGDGTGHTGFVKFDQSGNTTILHNGNDDNRNQCVNIRTRDSRDFATWFDPEAKGTLYYQKVEISIWEE